MFFTVKVQKFLIIITIISILLLSPSLYAVVLNVSGQPQTATKYRVTFQNFLAHDSHDVEGCGHWDMMGGVMGKPIELMRSTCIPADERLAFDISSADFNGQHLRTLFPALGPKVMEVDIPSDGSFTIEASGKERDATPDDAQSSYTDVVNKFGPQWDQYLNSKYGKQLSDTEKNIAWAKEIADGAQSAFKDSNSAWAIALHDAGHTVLDAAQIYAIWGTNVIPVWGQIISTAFLTYDLVHFIAASNPDDGIGVIRQTCSSQNNWCVGSKDYTSDFNGVDDDSRGDYLMNIKVEKVQEEAMPILIPVAKVAISGGGYSAAVPAGSGSLTRGFSAAPQGMTAPYQYTWSASVGALISNPNNPSTDIVFSYKALEKGDSQKWQVTCNVVDARGKTIEGSTYFGVHVPSGGGGGGRCSHPCPPGYRCNPEAGECEPIVPKIGANVTKAEIIRAPTNGTNRTVD
jgi:hypothetical protein